MHQYGHNQDVNKMPESYRTVLKRPLDTLILLSLVLYFILYNSPFPCDSFQQAYSLIHQPLEKNLSPSLCPPTAI